MSGVELRDLPSVDELARGVDRERIVDLTHELVHRRKIAQLHAGNLCAQSMSSRKPWRNSRFPCSSLTGSVSSSSVTT